jgi:hypothetical protein
VKAKVVVPNLRRAGVKGNSIDGNAKESATSDARVGSDTWLYGDLIAVLDWADGIGVAPIWKLPWDVVGDAIALDDPKAILYGNRDRILLTIDRWFYRCGLPSALKGNRPCSNDQTSTKHQGINLFHNRSTDAFIRCSYSNA